MTKFKSISPLDMSDNIFQMIGGSWMLITAGTKENYNMMTASWGGMGVLWGKPVCTCFIRPQRYTLSFAERNDFLTLSFFGEETHDILSMLGKKSGRDIDKMNITGLTPRFDISGTVYYDEAETVIVARKLYSDDIKEAQFIDKSIPDTYYSAKDYHKIYVCEIVNVLKR